MHIDPRSEWPKIRKETEAELLNRPLSDFEKAWNGLEEKTVLNNQIFRRVAERLEYEFGTEFLRCDFVIKNRDGIPVVFIESENNHTSAGHEIEKLCAVAAPVKILILSCEWSDSEKEQYLPIWKDRIARQHSYFGEDCVYAILVGELGRGRPDDGVLRYIFDVIDSHGREIEHTELEIPKMWNPPEQEAIGELQPEIENLCGLVLNDPPLVHWDYKPGEPKAVMDDFRSKGIDVLGFYGSDKEITIFVQHCRLFAAANEVGIPFHVVIWIVLIHELCHRVHHLGIGETETHWLDFWEADFKNWELEPARQHKISSKQELIEKLAEWNTLLLLRALYPDLERAFWKMQDLSPNIYRLESSEQSEEEFRNLLLEVSARKIIDRKHVLPDITE